MVSIPQSLVYLGFMAPLALAFSNTAPIIVDPYVNSVTAMYELKNISKPFVKFEDIKDMLTERTRNTCSQPDKIFIYQIDELQLDECFERNIEYGIRNVVYSDSNNVNFTIADECYQEFDELKMVTGRLVKTEEGEKMITKPRYDFNEHPGLVEFKHLKYGSVCDIKKRHHDINDKLIIQVLPSFETQGTLDSIKEQVQNLYTDDDDAIVITKKRTNQDDEEEQDAKIEEQIEHDFEEAESLAAEETDPISIFDSDKNTPTNGTIVKVDNLFTRYQFFTSGIWSGIIVSGFLLAILYGALSWLTSLEITYASFEKQVDYDKKNE